MEGLIEMNAQHTFRHLLFVPLILVYPHLFCALSNKKVYIKEIRDERGNRDAIDSSGENLGYPPPGELF